MFKLAIQPGNFLRMGKTERLKNQGEEVELGTRRPSLSTDSRTMLPGYFCAGIPCEQRTESLSALSAISGKIVLEIKSRKSPQGGRVADS